jgi:hypothetical protein
MQVDEGQIKGGGTESLMAENLLNDGQQGAFLQGHRGKPALIQGEGRNRLGIDGNPDRDSRRLWHRDPGLNLFAGLCKNPRIDNAEHF